MQNYPIDQDISGIVNATHRDPFSYLGMHQVARSGELVVRAFLPVADTVAVTDARTGKAIVKMQKTHGDGLFVGEIKDRPSCFPYKFHVTSGAESRDIEDPYRFPPLFGELDTYFLAEGTHFESYRKLGAHLAEIEGVTGVNFAVWAPNASRVAIVGDFNGWDGRLHPMRFHPGCGVWEIFLPGVEDGATYKYEIKDQAGNLLPLKADPYAFQCEQIQPHTASIVHALGHYGWRDGDWMQNRTQEWRRRPVSIYEVHLGSWRRDGENNRPLSYRELAEQLVSYVVYMGFTHIELLPIAEYPFDGSWGYQPIGLFAPTSRFGDPDDFRFFVDICHQAGIGIILDWVAAHFPEDEHGLARFDGTHLYEHADPRMGRHMDWGTLIYNYGRNEVANLLLANACYWLDEFHIDGLRVDAVASMIYLDYSRDEGAWLPNVHGGRENLEAVGFLKRLNEVVYARNAGIFTVAEESTAWPGVSRPTDAGGLGFGFKWNMGWMHDTLRYMSMDPVHRKHHQNDLTFGLLYAFTENFILPLSHDEVVHGKKSIFGRMPGDPWQQFANLRVYYTFMFTYPGKKLLFMGCEFGQEHEWNHTSSLDWHLNENPLHRGLQTLVRDLNALYQSAPALYERDCEGETFAWIDCNDADQSMLAYLRYGADRKAPIVVICNFTPVPRHGYDVGVPGPGWYEEVFNSDAEIYGGSNIGNFGGVEALPVARHGYPNSLRLDIPPLGAVVLRQRV